ncbi:MAG TPA: hypothetical protein VHU88_13475 [Sporichthyaceae bacterium]|nr:hypothetical protein [Sporichthyaceae bacterium]
MLIAALGLALSVGPVVGAAAGAEGTAAPETVVGMQIAEMAQSSQLVEQQVSERSAMRPTRAHTRRVRRAAVRRARRAIGRRRHWRHMCLSFVRTRYHLPRRQHSAYRAWRAAHHKHRHDRRPPAGVPVFWSGGSHHLGHVAISLGHGWIITTDLPRTGHVTRVRLSTIHRRWGLHYLGWTEDLEGYRIYRR